ncbi:hypothetical protein [Pseudomonas paraeruginosa]|uniref:hypothetical protein n=1 Tax=Pseudomonas paraeruginosa TaxID=2994495 RepID=UPI000F4F7A36|nr:hypothetical protein [Pseudomonas paraeruginosa]
MAEKLSRDTSQIWRSVGLALVQLGGGVIGVILAGKYGLSDQYSLPVVAVGIVVLLLSVLSSHDFSLAGIIMGSAVIGAGCASVLGSPAVSPLLLSVSMAFVVAGSTLRIFNDY